MSVPPEERARVKADSLRRAVRGLRDARKRLLVVECVESFSPLDPAQQDQFDRLVQTPPYQEVRIMQQTTLEKGIEQGREQGQREMLLRLLEQRFGTLPPRNRRRVEQMSASEQEALMRRLFTATDLKDLGV